MVQLTRDTETKLISPSESTYVYDTDGGLMDGKRALECSKALWKVLEGAFRQSNENCSNIEPNVSLKDYLEENLLASALDEELKNIILELAETWDAYVGDPFEKQSLKWVWLEECLQGGKC